MLQSQDHSHLELTTTQMFGFVHFLLLLWSPLLDGDEALPKVGPSTVGVETTVVSGSLSTNGVCCAGRLGFFFHGSLASSRRSSPAGEDPESWDAQRVLHLMSHQIGHLGWRIRWETSLCVCVFVCFLFCVPLCRRGFHAASRAPQNWSMGRPKGLAKSTGGGSKFSFSFPFRCCWL